VCSSDLADMRHRQSANLLSYRAALDSLSADMTETQRDVAYRVLREELALLGQAPLLIMLDRFWGDLQTYRPQPDIGSDALLELVLD